MAGEGPERTSNYFEALQWLADLISSNGLIAAVVVILASGIAWNLPALVEQCRLALRDVLKHRRKTRELDERIRRESKKLEERNNNKISFKVDKKVKKER